MIQLTKSIGELWPYELHWKTIKIILRYVKGT
jgi:hypothetical protein